MKHRRLGNSDLSIAPLVFGGNVFGWTIDEATSFRLLDAFADAGFNMIDTADVYSRWAPGNRGGESETIIGNWLRKSKKRDSVLIATKVGFEMAPDEKGLGRKHILSAVEDSLRRLRTDRIDLYQSHFDDGSVPIEETMETFDQLVKSGKVRAIGASQVPPARLKESLEFSRSRGLAQYCSLQPLYNLYDRKDFETNLQPICRDYGLGVINFYSLAAGFLSGKYRVEKDLEKSVRGEKRIREAYFNEKGHRIIRALDRVSERLGHPLSSIAVAWVLSNPAITAPIASATNLEQLKDLLKAVEIRLDSESLAILNEATIA